MSERRDQKLANYSIVWVRIKEREKPAGDNEVNGGMRGCSVYIFIYSLCVHIIRDNLAYLCSLGYTNRISLDYSIMGED